VKVAAGKGIGVLAQPLRIKLHPKQARCYDQELSENCLEKPAEEQGFFSYQSPWPYHWHNMYDSDFVVG